MAQNVTICWCNWCPLKSASPPLTNFSVGERRLMTSFHSKHFYKTNVSSHCLDLQRKTVYSLYSEHFGPKDFSIKQDGAGHVIHLNAIFKMKLGYFLVNYLS